MSPAGGGDLQLPEFSEGVHEALGEVLPAYSAISNPLDAWGAGNFEETIPACMEIVVPDDQTDLVAVSRDTPPGIAEREVWQSSVIVDAAARVARTSGKPVVVFGNISTGLEPAIREQADALGLPLLQGTRESLAAIQALIGYAGHVRQAPRGLADSPVTAATLSRIRDELVAQPTSLSKSASKRLLSAYGVPVTREALALSADAAATAAESLGFPASKERLRRHPSQDRDGRGPAQPAGSAGGARRVRGDPAERGRPLPRARIEGVLVQEMVPSNAVEVIVGSTTDPEFGPVVVFGLGGILVELMQDSALGLAPVTAPRAREMTDSTRGAALMREFRGRGERDVDALADAIVRVSHLAFDLRHEVAAIDVNPLMVLPRGRGVVAADALIIRHV